MAKVKKKRYADMFGKKSGGRLDRRARGGSIEKKASGGNVGPKGDVKPIKPDAPSEMLLPLRYSSKYGRSPATQGGMDTWIGMGGKRENYKRGGKAK